MLLSRVFLTCVTYSKSKFWKWKFGNMGKLWSAKPHCGQGARLKGDSSLESEFFVEPLLTVLNLKYSIFRMRDNLSLIHLKAAFIIDSSY